MPLFRILLGVFFLAGSVQAESLDDFKYKDAAGIQAKWTALGESLSATVTVGGDQIPAGSFPATFSQLKDWRVYWDYSVKADLSKADQILIKLKSPDPAAVATCILYFKVQGGWYAMAPFGVSGNWETKILSKKDASAEESPAGWGRVEAIRLSLLPGAKRDTTVQIAEISARSGWPLSHIGSVGDYKDLKEASADIRAKAKGNINEAEILARLDAAKALEKQAGAEKDIEAREALIFEGREKVAQAWAMTLQPKESEFRGFWVHHGDGVRAYGGERARRWKDVLPDMKKAGYNAIVPNMLWSGTSYYPSKVLKPHPSVAKDGDYLQELVDAAKPLGLEVHAWKVMFQFAEGWLAPADAADAFIKAGRMQKDVEGKMKPWLCPSQKINREHEIAALLDVAKRYDIKGVHLDYIRYGGEDVCFCDHCKVAFEKRRGKKVEGWPKSAYGQGELPEAYLDFKRDNITELLREIQKRLKKAKPNIELSAAVFSYPSIARRSVAQDWPRWAKENLLDWVSTMTYTEDAGAFKAAILAQGELFKGSQVKLRPGAQTTFDGGRVVALDTLAKEVQAVRDANLDGFMLFEYRDQMLDTVMPYMAAGQLRSGDGKLVLREVPSWAKRPEPKVGRDIEMTGAKLVLDDFEDGNLLNALRSPWAADQDNNQLGTRIEPMPLKVAEGGPKGSKYHIGLKGHYGKSQAPWPYAMIYTALNPAREGADLSALKSISFWAKGDGGNYELVLAQESVTDYGFYRMGFKAPAEWTQVTLNLKDFAQPGWAAPVIKKFSDVKGLNFQPAGVSDQDFEFAIDHIVFEK